MRIPSGKTDQAIYFVGVDATDLKTRETALSSFTVYRSRNGAAEVAYTTPTVTEIDATNMPGVYALLIDEDTTIASGSDSEEYCVHITHAGMAAVTRTIELYRRDTTTGRTLDVSAGGEAGIDWANIGSPTTAVNLSGTNIDVDQVVASVSGAVGSVTGLTASNLDATISSRASQVSVDVIDGIVDSILVDTAEIGAAGAGLTNINLPNQTMDIVGNITGNLSGSVGSVATGGITAASLAANAITAAKLDPDVTTELQAGLATAANLSTVAGYLDTEIAAILADTNEIQTDWADGGRLDLILDARASQTSLDTIDGIVDSILVDTAEIGAAGAGLTNINLPNQTMDIVGNITGNLSGSVGSVTGLTNATVADAVWDEDATAHQTQGTFGQAIGDPAADANTIFGAVVTGAAGATVAADIIAVKIETAAIVADTNELQTDWVDGGRLDLILDARASQTSVDDLPTNAELATALGTADDAVLAQVALVKAKTDNLPTDPADQSLIIAATDALATLIGDLPTNAELATALGTADDAVLAAIAALSIPTANANAEALLDRAAGVETNRTLRQALRIMLSALAGKASGLATSTATYRDTNDTVDRIVATVDVDGNRSALTLNAG